MTPVIKPLYNLPTPDLDKLPLGSFRYCSLWWVERNLPPAILLIINQLQEGLADPRISYIHQQLKAGGIFGHGRFHVDGFGLPSEVHRLVTFNGTPTEGIDGTILTANTVWEFSGDYGHRARKAVTDCQRLLLRVSESTIPFRDHWETQKQRG